MEYEKFGSQAKRAPDYTITLKSRFSFNVEVKRIRETLIEKQFEIFEADLKQLIQSTESPLAVRLVFTNKQGVPYTYENDLVERLRLERESIKGFIESTIDRGTELVSVDTNTKVSVRGFEEEFTLDISRPAKKPNPSTSWYGVSRAVFYVQEPYFQKGEYRKFGDLICNPKHLQQTRSAMVNILFIVSSNETHEEFDLGAAIASIQTRADAGDEQFFKQKDFSDTRVFQTSFRELGAIAFKGATFPMPVVWYNEKALTAVTDELREALSNLNPYLLQ